MRESAAGFLFEPPRYSYKDYKNWSEEWELINGYPYSLLPSATYKHQRCLWKLIQLIGNGLEKENSDCECYSRLDWIVDNSSVVRPDVMIVCGKFETDWLTFPPNLIVEIASPATYLKDRHVKYKLYELNNVKYYLLVDTEKEKVACYELINGVYQLKEGNTFSLAKGCEIVIDVEELWK
jgi:Uma2 family endonuclease